MRKVKSMVTCVVMQARRAMAVTLCLFSGLVHAQEMPGVPAAVTVSGVRFDRALNGAEPDRMSGSDSLVLASSAKTDFFRETDGTTSYGNAPVLLSAIDNGKPFTFTARVRPGLHATYDAGALYLWKSDKHWLKFAFERDERGFSRIVTVRTNGTSDDNNHDVVARRAAWLRVSSDCISIGFYYSTDGKAWQLVRVFRNDYPSVLWLGLSAQSPVGPGNSVKFDILSLSAESVKDFRKGQ